MTNEEILDIALTQSAYENNCSKNDFLTTENVIAISKKNRKARRYLDLPLECNLVSYGNNIVASVNEKHRDIVEAYISRFAWYHCFETPNLYILNDALQKHDLRVCFMAEYFLPDLNKLTPLPCKYETRILTNADFKPLYKQGWSNALCAKRKKLDVLGVGAYDGEKLIALAGCSADCDTMWQIGIDVLPEYRRQGLASALTSNLAIETLKHGKVPFYCASWSNVLSVRNAIKSGFKPSWVEMTAKSTRFVDKLNRE